MKTLKDIQAVNTTNIDDLSLSEINELLAAGKDILLNRRQRQRSRGIKAAVWKKHNPYRIKTTYSIRRDQTSERTRQAILNQAKSQLKDVIYTLNLQTTTVKGYKQWAHRQAMIGEKKMKEELNAKILEKSWLLYERWHQYASSLASNLGSEVTFKLIRDMVEERGPENVTIKDVDELMHKYYNVMDNTVYTDKQWADMVNGGVK